MGTETPLAAVHQYIDAFNRGDVQAMAATFAVPGQILDAWRRTSGRGRRRLRTGTGTS